MHALFRAYRGRSIKKFQPRSFIFPRFTSKHFNVKKMDMNRKTNEISPCLLVFLVQHAYNLQFIFIQFQTNSYMNPRGTMHHLQWYYYKGRNWPATVSFHRRRSVVHLSAACQNSVAMDPVSGAHTPTQVCESVLLVCTWECVRSRLYVLF
ncbi:uncharacterized protein LOC126666992 isoform X2 [Mercurialis annua]|uniref:uncharacterized protein LOC126666992 isoform X2 n=1 Tax=Mercurialis annua TaxID=3986 RepID=UPI002160256F|nr:uncharacterized protein LOC126666992 isoform X2 [Mercurialis annua]XP_050216219.1 uncharacterized protein LOC126666992 isoform X2 [Mercurialis annua]XP_055960247.1 uncharacterized protein LOC126666992 isoform X2 [Mercurialis annua]